MTTMKRCDWIVIGLATLLLVAGGAWWERRERYNAAPIPTPAPTAAPKLEKPAVRYGGKLTFGGVKAADVARRGKAPGRTGNTMAALIDGDGAPWVDCSRAGNFESTCAMQVFTHYNGAGFPSPVVVNHATAGGYTLCAMYWEVPPWPGPGPTTFRMQVGLGGPGITPTPEGELLLPGCALVEDRECGAEGDYSEVYMVTYNIAPLRMGMRYRWTDANAHPQYSSRHGAVDHVWFGDENTRELHSCGGFSGETIPYPGGVEKIGALAGQFPFTCTHWSPNLDAVIVGPATCGGEPIDFTGLLSGSLKGFGSIAKANSDYGGSGPPWGGR